jgi:signal transduction histidine kinase
MDEKELIKSLEIFAHKIRNPIHSVVINLDVLKVKLQKQVKDQPTLKHLEIANSELKRLSEIAAKYLDYLKKNDKERAKVDLKNLLG